MAAGRLRDRVVEWTLVLFSIVFSLLCIEAGYRAYLFYTFAVKADYPIVVIDTPPPHSDFEAPGNVFGPLPISTIYNSIYYNSQNNVVYQHRVRTNNLGWTSRFDYSVTKAVREYRIAIVGGSTTQASTNELAWTDVVQDQLNTDSELLTKLGVERFSVLNIAAGGADMSIIATPLTIIATRFSPDMILVNFSIENVTSGEVKDFKTPPNLKELIATPPLESPAEQRLALETIGDVEIPLYCKRGAPVISNPDCMVSPVWYVPPGMKLSAAALTDVKRTIARRRLVHTVLLSPRPLALLRALGYAVIPQAGTATLTDTQQRGFATALQALQFIRQLQPHLLLTHNPHLWHGQLPTAYLIDELVAQIRSNGFDIARMANLMPAHMGSSEAKSWYMFNGHWNDHGAEVYGKAIYRVVRQRLLAERSPTANGEESACAGAFARFENGRTALAKGDQTGAAAELDAAIAALPPDNIRRAKSAGAAYAHCGFVSELHLQRAALFEANGETDAAASQWQAAIASAEDPVSVYERRAALRDAKGSDKGAIEDFTELIRLAPNVASYYVSRGTLSVKVQDGPGALADFEVALRYGESDSAALRFRMSQARWLIQDYAGVVEDATAGLAHLPGNAGLLYMRTIARVRLGQLNAALADISAAIEADPKNDTLSVARANLLKQMAAENAPK